ncbi:hypothetical protein [Desulfatirhabdium butyrativorans]|uniref:hypothetical protein n=1 Tax=Desulfatirhabdium butyrativorans TaxID=340467 RepID=UPI0012EB254C|nr:hypothetical protein [Desulfatirhabdium butyrativorans]
MDRPDDKTMTTTEYPKEREYVNKNNKGNGRGEDEAPCHFLKQSAFRTLFISVGFIRRGANAFAIGSDSHTKEKGL